MNLLILRKTLLIIIISAISGCGGGGSSTPTTPTTPTPPTTPDPVVLSVTAVDGYLENARVYIDLNGNYSFDEVEPSAMTDAMGQVSFTLTDIAEGLLKPIIVEAIAGQTTDQSTGLMVQQSYAMVAPAASTVVSPLTTLAQLSLVQGQQADIASAVAAIKTQLGLPDDANIMADYLASEGGSEQLYAIARSLVQLLPESPTELFTGAASGEIAAALLENSGAIAIAVNDAIAGGAEPGAIFVSWQENGGFTATELTRENALAFIEDIHVWQDQVGSGFLQAASEFAHALQAAGQVAESDTAELLSLLADYSEGGFVAVKASVYREFNASLFVEGSIGTVTTSKNPETQVQSIQINAQKGNQSVIATITLDSNTSNHATLTANLDSETVTIAILEGSELAIDGETYAPEKMALLVNLDTKTNDDQVKPVHVAGILSLDTEELLKSDGGSTVIAPNYIQLAGMFELENQESFAAELLITAQPTLVDDQLHWEDVNVAIKLDANLEGVPGAYMILDATGAQGNNELSLILVYGDREIKVTISNHDDDHDIVITNKLGMTLTLDLSLLQNAENLGTLVMGANNIATISKVDGHYVVTFSDGQTVTLF